jgi:hypothetical protein
MLTNNLINWLGPDAMDKPGVLGLASTKPEIAVALLKDVQSRYGGFWNYCISEVGLTDEDLKRVVKNISKA